MPGLVLRGNLGRKLTISELDGNFSFLAYLISASGGTIIDHTYAELKGLYDSSNLQPGTNYRIVDFQTRHYIQFSDSNNDGSGLDEEINVGITEPLILHAISSSTFSQFAKSELHPQDIILYKIDPDDRENDYVELNGTGAILYREDTILNISRDYDWRNFKYRRWIDSVGEYYLIEPSNSPDIDDFIDFSPNPTASLVCSVSFGNASVFGLGIVYQTDNIVVKDSFLSSKIDIGYGSTFHNLILTNININSFSNIYKINNSNISTLNQVFITGGDVEIKDSIFDSIEESTFTDDIEGCIIGKIIDCHINTLYNCYGDIISGVTASDINTFTFNTFKNSTMGNIYESNIHIVENFSADDIGQCNLRILKDVSLPLGNTLNLVEINGHGMQNVMIGSTASPVVADFYYVTGLYFKECNILGGALNHNFISLLEGVTYSPTMDIHNESLPTLSRYDILNGHVEEQLSGGTLSYYSIVTP